MKGFQLEEACIDSVLLTISAAMFSTPSIFIYYYVSGLSVSTGLVLCCYWFALSCCFSCCYRWFKSRKNRSMVVEREEQLGNIAMHADQYVVRDSTTSIIEPTGYQQSSSLPCGPAAIVGFGRNFTFPDLPTGHDLPPSYSDAIQGNNHANET